MLLKFADVEKECTTYEYQEKDNVFLILDSCGSAVSMFCPVLQLDSTYDIENFQMIVLHNEREDNTENSIYPVYVSNQRIGWIFPIQALKSIQHDYFDNPFFLRYAYIAVCLLLEGIKSQNEISISSEIFLEDFYDDNISLLIIDKTNLNLIKDFELHDYTVSLYKNGYAYSGKGNLESEIILIGKRLNLIPIADELRGIHYIHKLFENEIPKNQEAFAKFYLYYQIIEIMISVVFEDKFRKFVAELDEDVSSLFDKRDELGQMIVEKQRVKWLFSNYVRIQREDRNILNDRCKSILRENNKKGTGDMAENLYAVRCLLVHNMYILSNDSQGMLEELNKCFLEVIMDMLLSFHFPEIPS